MLIAGGDTGGLLSGTVPLSTSTTSTAAAEIYEAVGDVFAAVGSLNTARESTTGSTVVLPNHDVLVAGGSDCAVKSYGPGGKCGSTAFGTSGAEAFQCDGLQTAELYNQSTQTWSLAGAGSGHLMTIPRSGATATLIEHSGTSLDGQVLITGGSYGSSFLDLSTPPPGCGPFGQVAVNTAEIYNPATDTFTATTAVPGCPAGHIPPVSTCPAGVTCDCTTGLPASCPGGGTPAPITSATETGTTVTVTSTTANPPNLVVGNYVTVSAVSVAGYNGTFAVTSIPTSTTFKYTAASGLTTPAAGGYAAVPNQTPMTEATESGSTVTVTMTNSLPPGLTMGDNATITGVSNASYNGTFVVTGISGLTFTYTNTTPSLPTGTGGFAVADNHQCGLVDSSPALLQNGQVLIAGGDYIEFLGQSSQQAFLFTPSNSTPSFTQTTPMNVPRELPGIITLPSGEVLVSGGLTGAAAGCTSTPSTPVAFTTNSSAEVFDPTAMPPTWTLTSGSSATPGAAGGMTVPRIAALSLFPSGTDSGLVIAAGGVVAVTTNGTTANFPTCESTANIHQTTQTATDLYDPTTTVFTATGSLNQSRGGYGYGILDSGTNSGDLVVIGGECAVGTLASAAIGSSEAAALCPPNGQKDYYELFDPGTGTWAVGGATTPATPANSPGSGLLQ